MFGNHNVLSDDAVVTEQIVFDDSNKIILSRPTHHPVKVTRHLRFSNLPWRKEGPVL
jgi:hypothetical protein